MRNSRECDAVGPFGLRSARRQAPGRARVAVALAATAAFAAGTLQATTAPAVEFGEGGLRGRLDTTVSHGVTVRVEERDTELAADTNGNDGNLNYDRGIVSNTSKFTSDLDVRRGDFGAFVRATGFIDFENENGTRERTPLSDAAQELVGKNLELLDAYVTGTFDAGDAIVDARLGRHVLNWGESTFIPNGINVVNHFDVSKLRLPGSELREALLPVGLASVAVLPTDALAVEAFYQLEWEQTEIDPVGSYFSSVDYAGPGAREAVIADVTTNDLGFGFGPLTLDINADLVAASQPPQAMFDPDFASVLRGPDNEPDNAGQWGLAMRYFAEELNDTEFGVYVTNYHSRLPTIGALTGSLEAVQAGLAAAGAVGAADSVTTQTVTQAVTTEVQAGVAAGLIPPAAAPEVIRTQVAESVSGIAAALAIDRYGKSGSYFLDYPEDIQLLGLSFNTVLGTSGWALQGEYSLRHDAPLQRAERRVIEDGLRPIIAGLGLAGAAGDAQARAAALAAAGDLAGAQAAAQEAQRAGAAYQAFLSGYAPGRVQGYIRRNVSQLQATATRVFSDRSWARTPWCS